MTDTKPWWQSITVWAGLVAFVYGALGLFGIQIGTDQSVVVDVIMQAVGIVVIYGRSRATKEIEPVLPASDA